MSYNLDYMTFLRVSFQLPIEEIKNLTAKNAKRSSKNLCGLCVLRALCGVLYQISSVSHAIS